MTKIRIITKKPGEQPVLRWVDNTLEAFQDIVGGYIETVPMDGFSDVLIICNEEGKLQGLQPCCVAGGDIILGPVAVVRAAGEEFASLTEEQIPVVIWALDLDSEDDYQDEDASAAEVAGDE